MRPEKCNNEYEYELDDVDDNTRSPVSANSNTTASVAVVSASASASCDVCLDAPRVKVALVPCGHATFCQQCIDTLVVINSHCPACRGVISSTARIYVIRHETIAAFIPYLCVPYMSFPLFQIHTCVLHIFKLSAE